MSYITIGESNRKAKYMRVAGIKEVYAIEPGVLYSKINEGKIRSICLKEGKDRRGTRLIDVDSLEKYLDTLAAAQTKEAQGNEMEGA